MTSSLRKFIYKMFHWLKLFPPRRIDSPERVFLKLKNQQLPIKEYELKRISAFMRIVNNQNYYHGLLKMFLPEWNLNINEASFIGAKGIGEGGFNTFRKVLIDDGIYFEKVYFSSSTGLQKSIWFQENIYEILKDKIHTSKIQKIYRGEILTVMYFEFLNLRTFATAKIEQELIKMSKSLYSIFGNFSDPIIKSDSGNEMFDFKNHFEYSRNVQNAKEVMLLEGIETEKLEKLIGDSKCLFTHGDIQETNIFKNNILIDWDTYGFFPIGFEVAFIYFRLLLNKYGNPDFRLWLEMHYKSFIPNLEWESFEFNFFYFVFVFCQRLFRRGEYPKIEEELLVFLKARKLG